MKEVARIALPPHPPGGGFDHAAVDPTGDRLYVAHPSNDVVEIVDLGARRHCGPLPGLREVAGVWLDVAARLLFTSNRGEDTASSFRMDGSGTKELFRVPTGVRPNGMAFDPDRGVLLVAGVGNPKSPRAPPTLTFVDVSHGSVLAQVEAPGRTRWALYHRATDTFYVNIADPAVVAAIRVDRLPSIGKTFPIPARGPHGLEQDPGGNLLYCACDEGVLVTLDLAAGRARVAAPLAGPPDVLWLNARRGRLYCGIGTPGTVQAFDLDPLHLSATAATGEGAHTLTLDSRRNEVHVFLPGSHEDLVLADSTS